MGGLVGAKTVLSGTGGTVPGRGAAPTARSSSLSHDAMGTPAAAGAALPPPGRHVTIVVRETTAPYRNALTGILLRKNEDGSYSLIGRVVRIRWRSSFLPVVMGTARDVHAGAVLQISGVSDGRTDATATQIVVLTGYVTVSSGAHTPAMGSSGTGAAPSAGAAMPGVMPRTWRVIAGFSQMLPGGNDSTAAVNAFYPRVLTIYAGDSVTWTANSTHEPHTITFGLDALLRVLEDPRNQMLRATVHGRATLLVNPAVAFPTTRGQLVERDKGSATTVLNCGAIGPVGVTTNPQSCTVTFPNIGAYAYDCLFHAGMPGMPDMDGVIRVIPRPHPTRRTWTVQAGTGTMTDSADGFVPAALTIRAGDRVTWVSGGDRHHTVSFGLDPRATREIAPISFGPQGPILAYNPRVVDPILPTGGVYTGGVASSGLRGLTGNYVNLPGQTFLKTPFTLTFPKPGVYTYYCLVHAPFMTGTITVLPL